MKGLYIYCIRNTSGKELQMKGIDGKSKVVCIPYKDIEAVVSAVDIQEYGSKELARRAKEDVQWIIKHAQRHEKVIEHAMQNKEEVVPVIPIKFGLIFEKPQNLEDTLRKEYQRCKKLLLRLAGKQEWSTKVYAKESALKMKLQGSEKKVQAQMKHAATLPRGADYFGELEVHKTLDGLVQKKTQELSKKLFQSLSAFAVESRSNNVLANDFAGHTEPMVLNSAYLVRKERVHDFVHEVKELQTAYPEFIFDYTGPWPPYNFVQ